MIQFKYPFFVGPSVESSVCFLQLHTSQVIYHSFLMSADIHRYPVILDPIVHWY